ncbi:MAG: hypothetical protein K2M19_05815 [Muribaculaceae bacterium]|nr:hypothetical protein [Muribaculaceae bacterium]
MRPGSKILHKYAYILPIVLIGTAVFFITFWSPLIWECAGWSNMWLAFRENPTSDGFIDILRFHYNRQWFYDNIRFVQTVGVYLYLLPPRIGDFVAAISVIWMLQSMALVSGVWKRHYLLFTLCMAGAVFLLPWYNGMSLAVWILNYSLPTALWAYTIWRWLTSSRPLSPGFAFFLGFMVSWMHELYSAILIASVGAVMLLFRDRRKLPGLMLLIGALIPLTVAICAPSSSFRQIAQGSELPLSNPAWIIHNFMIFPVIIGTVLSLTVAPLKEKCRNPLFWAVTAGAFGGFIVAFRYGVAPRTSWGLTACGIIMMVLILKYLDFKLSRNVRNIAVTAIWLLIGVHYTLAVTLAHSYNDLDSRANQVYNPITGESPVIYADYPSESRLRLVATLIKVEPSLAINYLYYRNVFPTEIAGFDPDSCRKVKSNFDDAEIYDCNGTLIGNLPHIIDFRSDHTFFSGSKMSHSELYFYPFNTSKGSFYILSPRQRTRFTLRFDGAPIDSIHFDLSEREPYREPWE